MMEQKKLVIPGGMYFGVTELPKKENENQKFEIDLFDNHPSRIIELTDYDDWKQTSGEVMLANHIELLGRAIKINFKELF
ncbi:hypothetical protein [Pedobacter roseus]|uniref:Uncharacterized protein n=1 Tax=Pedobacter roseus TaxID=336820 RepID=A0A7G9QGZ9_9SPHI|nr:hypothetical protein [Pedobacter roseus]QNN42624.1 hypothetical protein H9L23_00450 [Pedobacter roseus]